MALNHSELNETATTYRTNTDHDPRGYARRVKPSTSGDNCERMLGDVYMADQSLLNVNRLDFAGTVVPAPADQRIDAHTDQRPITTPQVNETRQFIRHRISFTNQAWLQVKGYSQVAGLWTGFIVSRSATNGFGAATIWDNVGKRIGFFPTGSLLAPKYIAFVAT